MVAALSDDTQLMLRVKAGDRTAFEALFHAYKRKIVNYARRYLGSTQRAEDAAQEVFMRLYRAREDYTPDAKFSTYLYRIATNTCLNHARKREWLTKDVLPETVDTAFAQPEAALQGEELRARVQKALLDLPEQQRTALLLLRFEDLSYDEIAAVMDTTVPAVKSLLNRARVELMKQLGDAC